MEHMMNYSRQVELVVLVVVSLFVQALFGCVGNYEAAWSVWISASTLVWLLVWDIFIDDELDKHDQILKSLERDTY